MKECVYSFLVVGKTTVARKFGEVYFSLGILPSRDVIELSVSDLMTGYVGQTGRHTRDKFSEAKGKVLFIDEAYQLNPSRGGQYAQEAVDEIVKCLTDPDFKEKMVVIFAGYESDIDDMLRANQGLQSRFQEKIVFHDFSPDKTRSLLLSSLETKRLELMTGARNCLDDVVAKFVRIPNFSNGRDIETLVSRIVKEHVDDCKDENEDDDCNDEHFKISQRSLEAAVDTLISERTRVSARGGPDPNNISTVPQPMLATATRAAPPPARQVTRAVRKEASPPPPPTEEEASSNKAEEISEFDICFEDVLNEEGMNTASGVKWLSKLVEGSDMFLHFAEIVARRLKISIDQASRYISDWQGKQRDVQRLLEEQEEEMELAKCQKRKAKVPIWQCQACGQACKPYIVCHYMPRVIRYEEIEV